MMDILALVFGGLFLSNVLIMNLVGLPIYDEKQVSLKPALKIGLLTTGVATVSAAIIYPINKYLIVAESMDYLLPLYAVLIIALVTLALNHATRALNKETSETKVFMPMISFNVIIFFITFLSASETSFITSIFYAIGAGLGYTLLTIMIVAMQPRLNLPGIPKAFKGLPITIITLGLIGLTFMGLAGLF